MGQKACELLMNAGLAPPRLAAWCREWLTCLLAAPRIAQGPAWLLLGEDLLHQLEHRLNASSQAASEVFALIPPLAIASFSTRSVPGLPNAQVPACWPALPTWRCRSVRMRP
ncbi:MAG TPA: hypothetical protein VGF67_30100 [Ktedonobacteraceae bacterium]